MQLFVGKNHGEMSQKHYDNVFQVELFRFLCIDKQDKTIQFEIES